MHQEELNVRLKVYWGVNFIFYFPKNILKIFWNRLRQCPEKGIQLSVLMSFAIGWPANAAWTRFLKLNKVLCRLHFTQEKYACHFKNDIPLHEAYDHIFQAEDGVWENCVENRSKVHVFMWTLVCLSSSTAHFYRSSKECATCGHW